jgi:hypothetical protein
MDLSDGRQPVVPTLRRMALEPPEGYVAFVARHLDELRDEAAYALGDEADGDRLYPEVLADVARRWGWLELRRRLPGQAAAADEFLRRALSRRIRRTESERIWSGGEGPAWSGEIQVWRPDAARPAWSSAAVRLARYTRAAVARVEVGPIAEAAIAWWHAYEARRRSRLVAALVLALVVVAVLMRVAATGD